MGTWWHACASLSLVSIAGFLCSMPLAAEAGIGMNWGTKAAIGLPPVAVVELLKRNGITKVKLFDADEKALYALMDTGIEVMVGIMNEDLSKLAYSQDEANNWVGYNIRKWVDGGVLITAVSVGNEPFLSSNNDRYVVAVPLAMEKVLAAVRFHKLDKKVKVVSAMNLDILKVSDPPSSGAFKPNLLSPMSKIVEILEEQGAPFIINIYDFITVFNDISSFDMEFIYFDGNGGKNKMMDNVTFFTYTNLFSASFDALATAVDGLSKNEVEIVIGEIGWPTDGDGGKGMPSKGVPRLASKAVAEKYINGVIQMFLGTKGTPLRPNRQIEGYLFGLMDEDAKSIAPGDFERHWGICKYDGTPKFKLNLALSPNVREMQGLGDDVHFLKKQWCVATAEKNTTLIAKINEIDGLSDATAILPGNNCYFNGDTVLRASYAFNNYYQERNQSLAACNKVGGTVKTTDPSPPDGSCDFKLGLSVAKMTQWGYRSKNSWNGFTLMLLAVFIACTLIAVGQ